MFAGREHNMPIYSHSRLGSFGTCPRQYWYAYIGKPDIERVDSIEAFLAAEHTTLWKSCTSVFSAGR